MQVVSPQKVVKLLCAAMWDPLLKDSLSLSLSLCMEAIELYDSMDSNQCLFVDDNYLFLNNCKNYYSRSNS